jgi:hypothetical protein
MSRDLSKLKVAESKAELTTRGLPTTGLKAELVARLTQLDELDEEQDWAEDESETVVEPPTEAPVAEAPGK